MFFRLPETRFPNIMTRYALTLSYNGSPFFGWQKQAAGIPTVQAALEYAIAQIAGEPVAVTAAGRTDTGVHATAQVVHFDSDARRPITAWVRGVNAFLPDSIAVLHAQEIAPDFHARFDAFGRRYRYLLQSAPVRSPCWRVVQAGRITRSTLPKCVPPPRCWWANMISLASALPNARLNPPSRHYIASNFQAAPT